MSYTAYQLTATDDKPVTIYARTDTGESTPICTLSGGGALSWIAFGSRTDLANSDFTTAAVSVSHTFSASSSDPISGKGVADFLAKLQGGELGILPGATTYDPSSTAAISGVALAAALEDFSPSTTGSSTGSTDANSMLDKGFVRWSLELFTYYACPGGNNTTLGMHEASSILGIYGSNNRTPGYEGIDAPAQFCGAYVGLNTLRDEGVVKVWYFPLYDNYKPSFWPSDFREHFSRLRLSALHLYPTKNSFSHLRGDWGKYEYDPQALTMQGLPANQCADPLSPYEPIWPAAPVRLAVFSWGFNRKFLFDVSTDPTFSDYLDPRNTILYAQGFQGLSEEAEYSANTGTPRYTFTFKNPVPFSTYGFFVLPLLSPLTESAKALLLELHEKNAGIYENELGSILAKHADALVNLPSAIDFEGTDKKTTSQYTRGENSATFAAYRGGVAQYSRIAPYFDYDMYYLKDR